jgi:hypothetical protein
MTRFVDPAEQRLSLSDGDYLIVKGALTAGETIDMYAAMSDAEAKVDPVKFGPALVTAYLLDWSLVDAGGRIVSVRDQPADVVASALRALAFEDYQEIVQAVQAHDEAVKAARQEKKRRGGGASASNVISPWHAAAAGGTNG